jgi:hypothetical protein
MNSCFPSARFFQEGPNPMKASRTVWRSVLPSLLLIAFVTTASAQQRGRGRVFTNDDLPAAPPPAAPAAAPAAAAPASSPTAATEPADPLAPPASPKERLERLAQAQLVLRFVMDQFDQKELDETDEAAKARWRQMSQSMVSVLQGHQQLLAEAQAQAGQQETAPAAPTE